MSYRPYLESGALRQMQGLPEQAFDMLVTLPARICDDPYDPVFSAPTGVPRRRVADVGDFGFVVFAVDEAAGLVTLYGQAEAECLAGRPRLGWRRGPEKRLVRLPRTGDFGWLRDYGDPVVPVLHAIRRRWPGAARHGALLALLTCAEKPGWTRKTPPWCGA